MALKSHREMLEQWLGEVKEIWAWLRCLPEYIQDFENRNTKSRDELVKKWGFYPQDPKIDSPPSEFLFMPTAQGKYMKAWGSYARCENMPWLYRMKCENGKWGPAFKKDKLPPKPVSMIVEIDFNEDVNFIIDDIKTLITRAQSAYGIDPHRVTYRNFCNEYKYSIASKLGWDGKRIKKEFAKFSTPDYSPGTRMVVNRLRKKLHGKV